MEAEIDFLLVNFKRLENEIAAMNEMLKDLERNISEINAKLKLTEEQGAK